MKLDAEFLSQPMGQFLLVGLVVIICGGALVWQYQHKRATPLPGAKEAPPVNLPQIFTRAGIRIPPTKSVPAATPPPAEVARSTSQALPAPAVLPLTVFVTEPAPARLTAPYGRLIPCETVTALESNRLDTPVIGLVTEDVWHNGRLVIPVGTEVHGRAALDRQRERIAVSGSWMLVWRQPGPDAGTELKVQGLALNRGDDDDGSAGLKGEVLRSSDHRELKLFAATFLSTATVALQDLRTNTGALGETSVTAATARNGVLAGTSAVLREYADQLRAAIARDGFYLRVPAGQPFYLYVTETLNRSATASAIP